MIWPKCLLNQLSSNTCISMNSRTTLMKRCARKFDLLHKCNTTDNRDMLTVFTEANHEKVLSSLGIR